MQSTTPLHMEFSGPPVLQRHKDYIRINIFVKEKNRYVISPLTFYNDLCLYNWSRLFEGAHGKGP